MGGLEFCKHCSRQRDCWSCEKLEDWVREHTDIAGDLISREAAVKRLKEKALGYTVSKCATSRDFTMAFEITMECASEVQNMDAVDAEPVRHGEWILHDVREYADGLQIPEYKCSICGGIEVIKEPYCHCGAKMDKEGEK